MHGREGEWDRPTLNVTIWKEWWGGKDDGGEKNAKRAGKVEERRRPAVQYCSMLEGGAWKNTRTHTHSINHS